MVEAMQRKGRRIHERLLLVSATRSPARRGPSSRRGRGRSGGRAGSGPRRSGGWSGGRRGSNRRLRSSRYRSEEHTSELQSLMRISYAVFCLNKKNQHNKENKIR